MAQTIDLGLVTGARDGGNADTLNGKNAEYYATAEQFSALDESLGKIGERINGTVLAATCPNEGASTEVGYITLTKGSWLIVAGGYSPINNGHNNATSGTTTIAINAGGYIGRQPLKGLYAFEVFSYKTVSADTRISVTLTSWESASVTTITNWDLFAVRISN